MPTNVGSLGSTAGRRRTVSDPCNPPIGGTALVMPAILGTGAIGFSNRSGTDADRGGSIFVTAGCLLFTSAIGFGTSGPFINNGGVAAYSGFDGGSLIGDTVEAAPEACKGSTAAGVGRGAAGVSATFTAAGIIVPAICQTVG